MGRPTERLTDTIAEAAAALGISPQSVRRRIADGTIPTVRIGGRILIPHRALEELIAKLTEAAS